LILDLRFNPGGLLKTAVEVADLFLTEGIIVSTRGRDQEPEIYKAKDAGTLMLPPEKFPMVVLVNKYSASASEIVAAALQDHGRAVVIGERTFGKGSVQNVIEMENHTSALKLTTASYWRPSGKNIHRFPDAKDSDEWGVKPNSGFEVPLTLEEQPWTTCAARLRRWER
jgi:carboxyl-terminal processing protease